MTIPAIRLCALLGAALLGACATPAPLGKDFAPGARAPTASELRALLRGKSYQTPTVAVKILGRSTLLIISRSVIGPLRENLDRRRKRFIDDLRFR